MMSDNENVPQTSMIPVPSSARRAFPAGPWLLLVVAVLAGVGWQWYDTRQKMVDLQQEVGKKLADFDAANKEARGAQKSEREQIDSLHTRLGALDGRLTEFQGQSTALQSLYQEMARSREAVTLLEVEQAITMAGQQLQLAGNVPVAIQALQAADAGLAQLDRPQYLALRKAVAKDLTRLSGLPFVDVAGISLRLEQVLLGIDQLPLVAYGRPEKTAQNENPAAALPWWEGVAGEVWQEIKGLIRIQRFDHDEAGLLAPGQAFFLRENLKLRLLNARLALLSRDQLSYRGELKAAQAWLGKYFDANDKAVQAAVATLRQMGSTDITVELPNLGESQAALRNLRQSKEKR